MFKKYFSLFSLLFFIVLFFGCSPLSVTRLNIEIIQNPTGGYNVDVLYCIFRGWLTSSSSEVKPITAHVEWWWENYYGEGDTKVEEKTWTFFTKEPQDVITYLYASPGYVFLNYYWVKIWWYDEDGKYNKVESSKAYCYSLSPNYDQKMKYIEESLEPYPSLPSPIMKIEKKD